MHHESANCFIRASCHKLSLTPLCYASREVFLCMPTWDTCHDLFWADQLNVRWVMFNTSKFIAPFHRINEGRCHHSQRAMSNIAQNFKRRCAEANASQPIPAGRLSGIVSSVMEDLEDHLFQILEGIKPNTLKSFRFGRVRVTGPLVPNIYLSWNLGTCVPGSNVGQHGILNRHQKSLQSGSDL